LRNIRKTPAELYCSEGTWAGQLVSSGETSCPLALDAVVQPGVLFADDVFGFLVGAERHEVAVL
jgi:hypothetical protein